MSEECLSSARGTFEAVVSFNRRIGPGFCRLGLEFSGEGAKAFAHFEPGQFAQLDISNTALPSPEAVPDHLRDAAGRNVLLRRPFSFAQMTAEGRKTTGELLYGVVGPATVRMTTLSAGDKLSIIGPLGRGFRIPEGKKTLLLVGGGMGTPPLQHLAQALTSQGSGIEIIAFAGARTAEALPYEGRLDDISQQLGFSLAEFAKCGVESLVATDDGTAGHRGLVTDHLLQWLEQSKLTPDEMMMCACGPEAMLARVSRIAAERNIDCQLSMERRMACGIGLCQSCAVECRVPGSSETIYKMCCEHGPVFDAKEVVF
ncbi:MAG: dihydroorotate dehydrogenase electron transfer subunit [Phycisphaerales bacterium]|nr:MAG: dihydroorotate dehydrogenase electron transfer subunit [Phycisphaerales bacterium]